MASVAAVFSRNAALAALAVVLSLATRDARAAEDEVELSVASGLWLLDGPDGLAAAPGATLGLWVGVSDWFWVTAELSGAAHPGRPVDAFGGLGLAVAFDVFALVPYVEVGLGVAAGGGTAGPQLRGALGLEYFLTSSMIVAVEAFSRPGLFDRAGAHGVALSLGWRFEPW